VPAAYASVGIVSDTDGGAGTGGGVPATYASIGIVNADCDAGRLIAVVILGPLRSCAVGAGGALPVTVIGGITSGAAGAFSETGIGDFSSGSAAIVSTATAARTSARTFRASTW
jgi:thiamine monophosphate synthase